MLIVIENPDEGRDMEQLSIDRLYRHMELAEVTAAQLAAEVGISRQAMYNIMNGKSQPRQETFDKICEALHCYPASLYGRDQKHDDHERFAGVVVRRYDREHDAYDVKSSVLEYVRNWLEEHYDDLNPEQFKAVRAFADDKACDLALDVYDGLKCFHRLFVGNATQATALTEAFISFFETLPSLIEIELGINMDLNIFDLEEMKADTDE